MVEAASPLDGALGAAVDLIRFLIDFALGGYSFGNLPAVKENFTLVMMVIIVISMVPVVSELLRQRREARAADPRAEPNR